MGSAGDTADPNQGWGVRPSAPTGRARVTGSARHADMQLGDLITYEGRRYVVRGLDPMGVPERRADLEDVETGEKLRVPIAELVDARESSA